MKKIMFNDKYGLTEAVLSGRKTMTRRIISLNLYNATDWKAVSEGDYEAVVDGDGYYHDIRNCGRYKVGEVVAVAQCYEDVKSHLGAMARCKINPFGSPRESSGWTNKMFVSADLMPHHIRITNIKVERLCDISDEDCRKEGVVPATWRQFHQQDTHDLSPQKYTDHDVWTLEKFRKSLEEPWVEPEPVAYIAETPKAAFAYLIDRISGKGTWERNPWVLAYEFEKID